MSLSVSEPCICFNLYEINFLGNLKSDTLVNHFLDQNSSSEDNINDESNRIDEIIKLNSQTCMYFTGNRLISPCYIPFPYAELLQEVDEDNILKNSKIFNEIGNSLKNDKIFNDYSYNIINNTSSTFLNSNVLNVFIRGDKGTGKSTLSLSLLNRLISNDDNSIKGIFYFKIFLITI